MTTFEQIGAKIDRELAKVRRFLKEEVKPTTQRKLAKALRSASERLARLADELQTRDSGAGRTRHE